MKNAINRRIRELIETLNMNANTFSKALGYERSEKMYNIINNRNGVSTEVIEDILKTFDTVNPEWLMLGKGDMFRSQAHSHPNAEQSFPFPIIPEPNITYLPVNAQAGYMNGFEDGRFPGNLPRIALPGFENGDYLAFNVEGDSMYPTLTNGDILICLRVERLEYIKEMELYVLLCQDGILVKRISKHPTESDTLVLHSDNSFYPPYAVKYHDIKALWVVKGYVSKNTGAKNFYERHLAEIQNDIRSIRPNR